MAANVLATTMKKKYLTELKKDEDAIAQAAEAYESARTQLEMGLRRYTALRDFVTEQLGVSPYAPEIKWPDDVPGFFEGDRGHYRFTGMRVGDAIVEVLREEQDKRGTPAKPAWMRLQAIMNRLAEGGLGFPEPVQARAINAAIQALVKSGALKRGQNASGVPLYRYVDTPAPDSDDGEAED